MTDTDTVKFMWQQRTYALEAELHEAQVENAKLRESLEGLVRLLDAHEWGDGPNLRRARAALSQKEIGPPEWPNLYAQKDEGK